MYTTAVVLALGLLSPFILPSLLNSHAVRQRLVSQLKESTGISLSPDNIQLILTPFPAVRIETLPLTLGLVNLSIGSLTVEPDPVNLLKGQLTIDRVLIQDPVTHFAQVKPGPSFFFGRGGSGFPVLPPDLVDKVFSLLSPGQGDISASIKGMSGQDFKAINAQITLLKAEKKILINATAKGIDLGGDRLAQMAQGLDLPFDRIKMTRASVVLLLDNQGSLKGKVSFKDPELTAAQVLKGPVTAGALALDFSLTKDKRQASLTPARITYPSARVGVAFTQDLGSGKTALTFEGTQVNIGQVRAVCLPLLKGLEVSENLFDILRAGTAQTVSVGFEAERIDQLFEPENLIISGQATAARVKIPQTPLMVKNAGAQVTMARGVLHIEPGQGTVSGTTLKGGVLDVDLIQDHEVPFSGQFSLESRLDTLPQTLALLLPGTRLAEEMAKISTISGTAKARLDLDMPLGKDLAVTVTATEIKAFGRYEPVALPIHIEKGNVTYKNNRVTLDGLSGRLGNNPVRGLTASATIGNLPRLELTAASGRFSLQELMPWAHAQTPALLAPVCNLAGMVTLDSLFISGPMFSPGLWQFSAAGTGKDIQIDFPDHPKALDRISARFKISQDHYAVSDLTARVNDLDWLEFAFDRDTLDSFRLPVEISECRVSQTKGMSVHGRIGFPAGPTGQVTLAGTDKDHLIPTLLTLRDPGLSDILVIPCSDPEKPRYSLDGRISTQTLNKLLVPGSGLHTSLNALTGGDALALYTDAVSDLHLDTRQFNLDQFLSRKTDAKDTSSDPSSEKSRSLLAQKRLFFKAKALVFQNRTFTNVDALVRFDRDATRVDISKAVLCGLNGTGQVIIPNGGAPSEITTAFSVTSGSDTTIAQMTSCLFKNQSIINGDYTFTMDLTGQGDRERIIHTQEGTLSFEAMQGRIFKATILSRVLSVINILDVDIKQNGFAYKRFTVEAEIKDSVIQLKKCYIDAENMAVIASGWLDPLKDNMDLTFLVAPFKTIDTFIKAIPVVNTILSGRLVSLPVRASGSIFEPNVVPLSPSAVGEGLVNMLKDLVKTPVRLFQDEKTP